MKNVSYLIVVCALTSACAPVVSKPPTQAPVPAKAVATLAFDLVACKTAVVDNYCTGPANTRFKLHVKVQEPNAYLEVVSDGNGYVYLSKFPAIPNSDITITVDGFNVYGPESVTPQALVDTNAKGLHNFFRLVESHVDPASVPIEDKLAVRGAMWTARRNVAYGPRPNRDTNILSTLFVDLYDASTRNGMLSQYSAQNYTHGVVGPVQGNDCYHSLWPCRIGIPTQQEWDAYLDSLQENFWDRHIVPIYFAKPDGWERAEHAADMDALDALYRQPRAQKLIGGGIVVYPGWEPSGDKYGWKNDVYVKWVKRGHDVFPNAIHGLHLVSDLDAPTGGDDDKTFPKGQGNALSWVNVAPYISIFFDQVGGYVGGGTEVPSQFFMDELCKHATRVRDGFRLSVGGWPTFSERGNDKHIIYVAAEYAAFGDTWWDWNEKYAKQIGDHAMSCGAEGYLDGGTVAVPRIH